MIVITAGTADYHHIVKAQARKCAEFGYEHRVFDLGALGMGTRVYIPKEDLKPTVNGDSLPPATFKTKLMLDALIDAKPSELVCWLDGDCIPLLPFEPACDMAAVTLRPVPEIGLSNNAALDYLNSGVVWIRNTVDGRTFARAWREASIAQNTDQGGLNACVLPAGDKAEWIAALKRGRVEATRVLAGRLNMGRVQVLDAAVWNSWHPPFTGARIAHFKRGIRNQAVNYL